MISYDEAIARILAQTSQVDAFEAPLLQSVGMTLSSDVVSPINLPTFANSQMDGYAVIAADTTGASETDPIRLTVVGEIAAGSWPDFVVTPGCAAKIFTGAPIPSGADAVVPVEDVLEDRPRLEDSPPLPEAGRGQTPAEALGESPLPFSEGRALGRRVGAAPIAIAVGAKAGQYVRPAGQDIGVGDTVLLAGSAVTPATIAIAAATGHERLSVRRRPRVCVIGTGNELIPPGAALGPGQIYDSNSYSLAAQVEEAGAECMLRLAARDTVDALKEALSSAAEARGDVIVTCGGVSVGDHDLVRPVFATYGAIDFWRVAIRPGKPFVFGRFGAGLFFGLPGNPASAMATFELFVRPALLRMQGRANIQRPLLTATVTESVSHAHGRRSFIRASTSTDATGGFLVTPATGQGSHMFRSLVSSNSLLVIPEDIDGIEAGSKAQVVLTGSL